MRVYACALAISLALAFPAEATPRRVASLDLCTDELVLLLAAPGQLISVSRVGGDPQDNVLAARTKGLHLNDGSIVSVAGLSSDLVVTMGGGGRDRKRLARALGSQLVNVPPPQRIEDVRDNVRLVATALGRDQAGEALIRWMDGALGSVPKNQKDAILLGGNGASVPADGLAAEWLSHAGLSQRALPGDRAEIADVLAEPPQILVTSSYRSNQVSLGQMWLKHPALRRLPATTRRVSIDGRAWTCLGPLVAQGVTNLRRHIRP